MESDLKLIQKCGFNSFEEVIKRFNELVEVMRVGRVRAEKKLDRFTNEAKKLLKDGQKDKAKKMLLKKKNHGERVKTIDAQLDKVLEKLREVKNSTQMLQVIKASKYCNNLILSELTQKDLQEENTNSDENQDLLDIEKEITKYLDILTKSSKKNKVKPATGPIEQKVEKSSEEDMKFPQPEDNNIEENNNTFPQNNNKMINNNNANIGFAGHNQNQAQNSFSNNNMNNNNNNFNNYQNNNNSNNNNFNNNNYNFNNISKPNNPYDNIF